MITEQFLRTHRPKTHAEHHGTSLNGRIGLRITQAVGTMWAAYAFGLLTFYGLPAAMHGPGSFVQWASSQFLQLVLLPIVIVGQNIQAKAADERAALTFADTELLVKLLNENTFLTNAVRELTKEIHGAVCQSGDRR